ncbi:MAG TPA: DNA topoisomerase [Candidatus Monoglobus merdigallinarum]|uniref:DNA topoisomerase (ATP-hydrolyzing) n=1 Tax=Candidatus Monoglobus merdigallinarum TaxID=2838698 RepID=A0A9D1PQT0_9FIRM|nr:DNA topoisomerase [Candidatus Monoglobus merdigallinarum]
MCAKKYGNESIRALKGADRVRKRPAVIFGSDGIDGCEHSMFEILSNSIDEAREGFGDKIIITRYNDKSIEVEDYGRGIPVDYNEREKKYNWELVFCELYAGGKYKNNSGGDYEFSLGLNGLGACATQYSSEYMDVEVRRDGFKYELHFEKGKIVGELAKTPFRHKKTGSKIRWKPDLEVFTDIDIPLEFYKETLKRQAVVNSGIRFILKNQTAGGEFEEFEFFYENGIADYVKELAGDKAMTAPHFIEAERSGRDRDDLPEYKLRMSFAFCFSTDRAVTEYYHNSSFLEYGGSPDKAVRNAFVYALDKYLKQNNKYNKNEAKIQFSDVQDSLILVSSSYSTMTSYENQTKKAINNKFIQDAMTEFLREQLGIYFIENKLDADKICTQVLVNKRSRETAERTRINVKKKLGGSLDVANRVKKFVDCRSKDPQKREVYIVEGDSALGACKQGRDSEFQAIIPIRGKILNCLKAEYDKIFSSDVIVDLLRVLGCGVEIQSRHNKDLSSFDLSNLRWNKVIICTDADFDGFQIRTLVLTMIYRLVPTLIEKGYVYIAESPLYEISTRKKTYFAFNEQEKAAILKKLGDTKYTIQRSKGLGENQPEMMWETTMNPETRRLIKVMPCDVEKTKYVFDLLLGDNLSGRKEHIAECGHNYIDMADIS